MQLVVKNARDRYLVCSRAKTGAGCTYKAVRYQPIEAVIVNHLEPMAQLETLSDGPFGDELRDVESQIDGLRDTIETLTDPQAGPISATLRQRIADMNVVLVDLERHRDKLAQEIEENVPALAIARMEALRDALKSSPLNRTSVNRLLRQLAREAILDFDSGTIVVRWRHGGSTEVQYKWVDL